jgi:hypothetical protein
MGHHTGSSILQRHRGNGWAVAVVVVVVVQCKATDEVGGVTLVGGVTSVTMQVVVCLHRPSTMDHRLLSFMMDRRFQMPRLCRRLVARPW